jgi:hypothetical protein
LHQIKQLSNENNLKIAPTIWLNLYKNILKIQPNMEKFITIKRSGFLRKLMVFSILIPLWLFLLWIVSYSKLYSELMNIQNYILFVVILVFLVILSDNLHKILARKITFELYSDKIILKNHFDKIIKLSQVESLRFVINNFDNKLWVSIKLISNELIELQIIDNWFKTPFLMLQSKRNFLRIIQFIQQYPNFINLVDKNSIDKAKIIMNIT